MSHKNIKVPSVFHSSPVEFWQETKVLPVHFAFGVLMGVSIVPVASLKTSKKHASIVNDPFIEVRSAGQEFLSRGSIVVPVDKKERYIECRDHKIKVVLWEIAAGDNAVNVPKALFAE